MCRFPTLTKNKKYVPNKKNDGVPAVVYDNRTLYVPRGCGNCIECRKQKAREWQVRLLEEVKENKNGKFITLTFSNESIKYLNEKVKEYLKEEIKKYESATKTEDTNKKIQRAKDKMHGYGMDNEIATHAMRLFNERWRKKTGKALRHFTVTELGHEGTENIHLHGIAWTNEEFELIREKWEYGYVYPRSKEEIKQNYVNARTVNYIIKYISKMDKDHITYKSKVLASNKPGIGSQYIKTLNAERNKYNGTNTREYYKTSTGHKIALPIYWRNKLYTDEEREKLWIQKLDKQERWVGGEKVDVSLGEEEFLKLLKHYQAKNRELGYTGNEKNWELRKYEEELRDINRWKRINNIKNTEKK